MLIDKGFYLIGIEEIEDQYSALDSLEKEIAEIAQEFQFVKGEINWEEAVDGLQYAILSDKPKYKLNEYGQFVFIVGNISDEIKFLPKPDTANILWLS